VIGGGDAKLAAATVIWVGWGSVIDYLLIASVFGGLLAMFLLSARQFPLPLALQRQPWIARLHEPRGGVPFGVALGLGGVIVYPQTAIWLSTLWSQGRRRRVHGRAPRRLVDRHPIGNGLDHR
jgi:prepilin peptidase CpaA